MGISTYNFNENLSPQVIDNLVEWITDLEKDSLRGVITYNDADMVDQIVKQIEKFVRAEKSLQDGLVGTRSEK